MVTFGMDGQFTYTPADHFAGEDSFESTLLDEFGATDTGLVSLDVVQTDPSDPDCPHMSGSPEDGGNDEVFYGSQGDDAPHDSEGTQYVFGLEGFDSFIVQGKTKDFSVDRTDDGGVVIWKGWSSGALTAMIEWKIPPSTSIFSVEMVKTQWFIRTAVPTMNTAKPTMVDT